jgi:leader peptidase (prepilin peptidase) / N-methyltransferase
MEIALAFFAGLLIGSFLNVCVYRLPRDMSVAKPARSICPGCEKTIAWYDNVPLLSYVLLRGRCRHCGWRIPARYPLVELAAAVAFALSVAAFGVTLMALKYALFSAIMIALIATDLEERILPDEFTLGGTLVGLVLAAFVPLDIGIAGFFTFSSLGWRGASVADSAAGAIIPSALIWLVAWLWGMMRHREVMGLGDVKMLAAIGAFWGIEPTLLALIGASLFGSVTGVPYAFFAKRRLTRRLALRIERQSDRQTGCRRTLGASSFGRTFLAVMAVAGRYQLPFGSFLGAAGLLLAIWGRVAETWYSSLGQ